MGSRSRWVAPMLRFDRRRHQETLNYLIKDGAAPIQRRSSFVDWNYSAELKAFSARKGETFSTELLIRAFNTESHEKALGIETIKLDLKSNEILAIEGEKLINSPLVSWLRNAFPDFPEKGIEALRDFLTCEDMLTNVSFHIGTRKLTMSEEYLPNAATLVKVR